jgi:uncharacterized protein YcfJ
MEAIVLGKSASLAVALAVLAASGCASFPARDPALDDARLSLDAAQRNPQVAIYAPTELDQAAATLRQADDLAAGGGPYADVHGLAVLASQRAAAAQDAARVRSEQAALAAQRTATDARIRADVTQQQAAAAQLRAAEAQRQAEDAQRLAAAPPVAYDYRRRQNEPLYEAPITSVRAVVGPPQQRCWVERQIVDTGAPGVNVPGAVVGGVVGGILGHQIGSGRGQDVASGIGAVTGAVVGANVGRDAPGAVYTQDVQRCESVPSSARLDYWDATYNFRGYEHHVQLTSPPGATILVNAQGEPRI